MMKELSSKPENLSNGIKENSQKLEAKTLNSKADFPKELDSKSSFKENGAKSEKASLEKKSDFPKELDSKSELKGNDAKAENTSLEKKSDFPKELDSAKGTEEAADNPESNVPEKVSDAPKPLDSKVDETSVTNKSNMKKKAANTVKGAATDIGHGFSDSIKKDKTSDNAKIHVDGKTMEVDAELPKPKMKAIKAGADTAGTVFGNIAGGVYSYKGEKKADYLNLKAKYQEKGYSYNEASRLAHLRVEANEASGKYGDTASGNKDLPTKLSSKSIDNIVPTSAVEGLVSNSSPLDILESGNKDLPTKSSSKIIDILLQINEEMRSSDPFGLPKPPVVFSKVSDVSGYSDKINKYIRSPEEAQIYKNADLKETTIGNRPALIRNDIDWSQKDEKGKTNSERISLGRAPLDKDGKPIELHHIGQHKDSPLAELTMNEHRGSGNDTILHNKNIETEVRAEGTNWTGERKEYWENRSQYNERNDII